ncbi:FHA domain-containing protein [Mycobacterium sp. 1245111.1]|uniref:FHA domain-containing protein n=1 Tax=Mycobacterium sp. 1245111.1 TaxID=1834073 RepID=UPI0009F63955|nr:FHA domain-containing protein [Mycobacterium sp. 1245111.1]
MQAIQGPSPSPETAAMRTTAALKIRAGTQSRTFEPSDAPIIIGRDQPAHIIVGDEHISRTHVHIDHDPVSGWVAHDRSRNGIFVDGERQSTITIRDKLALNLGSPTGVAVTIEPALDANSAEDVEVTDPGVAFAGAAVAARRDELNVSQRSLARAGIVNAGGLAAFEKGRRWPRPATRTQLEHALQWPQGHISDLRRQGTENATARIESDNGASADSSTVRTSLLTDAAELALGTIKSAIATLPEPNDPAFKDRVATLLGDLRRLEAVAANAAQSAKGAPDVTLTLSAVRKTYRELMLRAARAPSATLGQQLYAARQRHELSTEDAANAAGVPTSAIEAVESEIGVDANTRDAIKAALAALNRRR